MNISTINLKSLYLITTAVLIFFTHDLHINGINVFIPIMSFLLITYVGKYFIKDKEYSFLTIVTFILMLVSILTQIYLELK